MSLHKFAEQVAAHGRGDDSLLVHMTPDEVQRLQAFAEANGTTMTINPETGLPEAGMLSDLFKAVAPIALGAFLGPAGAALGGGFMSAGMAGLTVGGLTTLATGSLSRGLMAGLGAYGGAGLGESLMSAGSAGLATEAATTAGAEAAQQGLSEAAKSQAIDEAVRSQGFKEAVGKTAASDVFSQGLGSVASNPMGFAKDNWKYLAGAAAPIMAGAMVPTTTSMPASGNTGFIRQKIVNSDGTVRDLTPVKASEWGSRNFSDVYRGYKGGGIVALAAGGAPTMLSDEQLYQKTGSWEAAAAARDDQNRAANIYADAQKLAAATAPVATATPAYFTANPDVAKAFTENSYGMTPEAFAQTHFEKYGQAEGRALPSAAASYAAANNIDLTGNINQWVADNPFATAAQVSSEAQKYGVSDTDIQKALSANTNISDAARYALTHNMGLAGLQQGVLAALKANPNATQAQIDAAQAQYGLSNADIQSPLAHGYQIANDQTAAASKYLQDNKDVARWISSAEGQDYVKAHPEFDASDIAWTHYQRYGKDEGRKWGLDKKTDTVLNTGVDTGAITSVVPNGFYGNATNPGDITTNADGTVTVHPNIPYRQPGGFSGMGEVKNAYTKGGGSTGYAAKAPKTMAEFNEMFNKQTGDSLAAYNYLMGKGAYPTKSGVGEISRPYREATLGYPGSTNKMYNWDPVAGKMVRNPDYVAPGRDANGNVTYGMSLNDIKKALSDKPLEGQALYDWAMTNNLSAQDIADATGMKLSEVYSQFRTASQAAAKKTADDKAASETTSNTQISDGLAAGGMAGYAMGGGLGSLGSYSDGGRLLKGPGDGVSDSIPATIGAKQQPARLADGEFVIPARIVSELGNGSTDAGAKKLYAMMDRVQKARGKTTGKNKVAANSRADKYLPA